MTVFVDTETTGLSPDDEVVEIAIVNEAGNVLLETLVKPVRCKSWQAAQSIHGISPAMVEGAPAYAELAEQIAACFRDQQVVIYNSGYDSMYLCNELESASDVLCCMTEYSQKYGEWSDYWEDYQWEKLSDAAAHVGHIWSGEAHRALADTLACRTVWQYLTDPEYRKKQDADKKARHQKRAMDREIRWLNESIDRAEREKSELAYEQSKRSVFWFMKQHILRIAKYQTATKQEDENNACVAFAGINSRQNRYMLVAEEKNIPVFRGPTMPKGYIDNHNSGRYISDREYHGLKINEGSESSDITLLYNKRRIARWPKKYDRWGNVPDDHCSMSRLQKRFHVPRKVRETLKIKAYVYSDYKWSQGYVPLYRVPEPYFTDTLTQEKVEERAEEKIQ